MTIEHGVVREVWFAPADNPTDKNSFLVRDDAYSKREAVFGRTMRLGAPVDLGPFGAWRQTNWSGGHDQERWKDESMFELGTADVSERRGAAKLWNGYTGIAGFAEPNGVQISTMMAGATGLGDDNPLFFAENTYRPGGAAPASWRFWKYNPNTGVASIEATHGAGCNAMGVIGDSAGGSLGQVLVGFANGFLYIWDQPSNVWTLDFAAGAGPIGWRTICSFNGATYYTAGNLLQRRAEGTHTTVATVKEVASFCGMTVWNNRLWFLGNMSQGRTGVFVSDGYTVQLAFIVPGNFIGWELCAHYGSLYIRGIVNHFGATANDTRQQVWRYNGSSMSLLWEDEDADYDFMEAGGMVSWGRHLVWGKNGGDTLGREAGVWMYDAEEDAIYLGPTIPMDPATSQCRVTALAVWNNTLAVAFMDWHTYTATTNQYPKWVAFLEKTRKARAVRLDGTTTVDADPVRNTVGTVTPASFNSRSFGYPQTTKTQVILSSSYDADLPGEKKVWAKGYIRCRVPAGTQVRLALLHDDSPTEHPVKTVAYDAGVGSGWQDIQFSAVCATHGTHEKSGKVRYKLYLENTNLATYPNNSPEVEAVGLDFMPSPTSRRSQYHIRVLADDGQTRLDGTTANPLTTREAIVAKLTEYWDAAVPVLFWEPLSDGSVPTGTTNAKYVLVQDFLEQSYRLDSTASAVASEVSFNLLEVA